MREALIRYRDEVVAHKRSKDMETKLIGYKLRVLLIMELTLLIDP